MLSVIMPNAVMLSIIMLSVVMLSVIMLSVVLLSVIMLNVVAPIFEQNRNVADNLCVSANAHLWIIDSEDEFDQVTSHFGLKKVFLFFYFYIIY
jgi:hypothetical protein